MLGKLLFLMSMLNKTVIFKFKSNIRANVSQAIEIKNVLILFSGSTRRLRTQKSGVM